MDGKVFLRSTYGIGTIVTFYIPHIKSEPESEDMLQEAEVLPSLLKPESFSDLIIATETSDNSTSISEIVSIFKSGDNFGLRNPSCKLLKNQQ